MARYFFHLFDGEAIVDEDGAVMRDDIAARRAALISLAHTVGDHSDRFWRGEEWTMRVEDETGRQVCLLKLCVEAQPAPA